MDKITFGTDGWRGIIGDDFTFANVRRVAAAIAQYVREETPPPHQFIVGYDTRFLSADAARVAAETVAAVGIPVALADRPTPTPAVSYTVVARRASGAIMVTASHNPFRWNGLKFKASYGGSASPTMMRRVADHLDRRDRARRKSVAKKAGEVAVADLVGPYSERLKARVNLDLIRAWGHRFVIDPMYGAGRGVITGLFDEVGIPYHEIHSRRNPLFPGLNPEPIEPHVADLRRAVLSGDFVAGLATDGDADRLGAINSGGAFIDSHKIFSILLMHLAGDLGQRGEVVKTFSTTQMVDKLAAKYSLPLHVTPIGFKYICELMLTRDVLVGGEESGGIGTRGDTPERDGILNSLLLAQVMAERNQTLGEMVQELEREFGPHHYGRVDMEIDRPTMLRLLSHLRHHKFRRVAGMDITDRADLDGLKLLFGDSAWLLVRPSGTENLLRLYAEAPSAAQVKTLLDEMAALARSKEG
ncbi:MAG TPA: phosphoglucomutase/phosphomannomutase family protein [Terriglobia bacterium]|nr:phosphoglucomutase/phosphomannomutase family protein [Terriglobia bacterium]